MEYHAKLQPWPLIDDCDKAWISFDCALYRKKQYFKIILQISKSSFFNFSFTQSSKKTFLKVTKIEKSRFWDLEYYFEILLNPVQSIVKWISVLALSQSSISGHGSMPMVVGTSRSFGIPFDPGGAFYFAQFSPFWDKTPPRPLLLRRFTLG